MVLWQLYLLAMVFIYGVTSRMLGDIALRMNAFSDPRLARFNAPARFCTSGPFTVHPLCVTMISALVRKKKNKKLGLAFSAARPLDARDVKRLRVAGPDSSAAVSGAASAAGSKPAGGAEDAHLQPCFHQFVRFHTNAR